MLLTIVCLVRAAFFNQTEKLKKRRENTEERRFLSLPALVKLGSKKSHEMLAAAEEWEGQRQQIQNLIHHLQKPFPIISNTSHVMSRLGRVCVSEDFRFSISPLCYFRFSVLVINGNVYPCRPQNLNYQDETQIYRALHLSPLFSACAMAE